MNRIEALKTIVAYVECDKLPYCHDCKLRGVDCDHAKEEAVETIKSMIRNYDYLSEKEDEGNA